MTEPVRLSRRQVLTGAAVAATGAAGFTKAFAISSLTLGPRTARHGSDTLVVLFLRGGADGLNIVVPHGDDDYYRLRTTLALARPRDLTAPKAARALDLNGFFGLHPALAPLAPLYAEGVLAAVHAVGSADRTRSHFQAMATMERGLAQDTGAASGWLARHLLATAEETDSPLRAVAVSETMPDSLRGATSATALTSLSDYRLQSFLPPTGSGGAAHHAPARTEALLGTLKELYAGEDVAPSPTLPVVDGDNARPSQLASSGRETLAAMEAIRRLDPEHYRPAPGVVYPANDLGNSFRQVACLVKGHVGLEVACLDMGGWDTHVAQGRDSGWQPARLGDLGRALAAFRADLGAHVGQVTTVVMTEFGRRAYENSGLGTDHGRATFMLVMGGGIAGGKVYARWPGLSDEALEDPGDLKVTTDYRDVLAEIVARRLRNPHLSEVFPGYTPAFHGIAVEA